MIGRIVSHLRIIAKLGRVGRKVVYQAEDDRLGRHFAAKFPMLPGELKGALDPPEQRLKIPYCLPPGWFAIDLKFAPLISHPRLEQLPAGTECTRSEG